MRLLIAALILAMGNITAAIADDFTRFLIPVTAVARPGAHGSLWTTEWTIFNGGDERLFVSGPFPYLFLSPPVQDNTVDAFATKLLTLQQPEPGFDGAFISLPNARLDRTSMSLRVRDVSVNAQSYGVAIPIVPVNEFKAMVRLIDVPTDAAYRATLRVYGASAAPQSVRVTIYAPDASAPIEQFDVTLQAAANAGFEETPRPSYVQLDPLPERVRGAGPKVRIEIASVTPGAAPIWAFVSISHNRTQQVTVIVP